MADTKTPGRSDDLNLISDVTLYRGRPMLLSMQVAPFAFLWAAWAAWAAMGEGDISEIRRVCVAAALVLSQILCFLAAHWSIAAKCVLTCAQVSTLRGGRPPWAAAFENI